MGVLSDIAADKILQFGTLPMDRVENLINEQIVSRIDAGVTEYDQIADSVNLARERLTDAKIAYERVREAKNTLTKARKAQEASVKVTESAERASIIASALDKFAAAVRYGLSVLKEKTRGEIKDLKDIENLFGPIRESYEERYGRYERKLEEVKKRLDKIEEDRRKQEARIQRKRKRLRKLRGVNEKLDAEILLQSQQAERERIKQEILDRPVDYEEMQKSYLEDVIFNENASAMIS